MAAGRSRQTPADQSGYARRGGTGGRLGRTASQRPRCRDAVAGSAGEAAGVLRAKDGLGVGPLAAPRGARHTGVEAVPDRQRGGDDEILAAFMKFLNAEVGDNAVKLLTVKMDDDLSQRDVIRHPEFAGLGGWRIRRLMAKIKDAARAFAERQGDDAILAAINRLTRTDEWCGGRAWLGA